MPRLSDLVLKVRSKNAGPFWLTIDIFCGSRQAYEKVTSRLATGTVATLYKAPADAIKRFDIADLNVVKFSLPRPVIQGSREDRDMHGAGWAVLLEEAVLD
ncbi:MAG: DUF4387 family protein [Kiloniellaceae bacterium]